MSHLRDRKTSFVRVDALGFGATPIEIDVRLSIEDSPSAPPPSLEAVRVTKAALSEGRGGVLDESCRLMEAMKEGPVGGTLSVSPRSELEEHGCDVPIVDATKVKGRHWSARSYAPQVVPEAELKATDAGLVPVSAGWFVMNARGARWIEQPGRGHSLPLTGVDDYEAETFFAMLGMAIRVINPGEPTTTYHWETEQEDFLVLSGEAVLIVEGQERPLEQWAFVHCPPETRHAFAGVGDGPCVLLCASSRQFQKNGPWGFYCADEIAARYHASSPEDTRDGALAYARFAPSRPARYRNGLLPG